MCFSATASFISGAILSIVSLLSIQIARSSFHKMLALVPLFFGIQQAVEGVLWLTIAHNSLLARASIYSFLFFALMFWPLAIPGLLWWYERIAWRKFTIFCSLVIGSGLGIFFAFNLVMHGAQAEIYKHNIYYYLPFAQNVIGVAISNILYLVATLIPLFISSRKYMWVLGVTLGIAYLASIAWFSLTMLSIWCFFAALLSGIIGAIIYYANDEETVL